MDNRKLDELLELIGYRIEPVTRRFILERRRRIHYLHIGKNAGTQIAGLIKKNNEVNKINYLVKHRHNYLLRNVPLDDGYFFSIRNPISRFRSGFYSIKNKGYPGYKIQLSNYAERAFLDFEHANDLAESIFEGGDIGANAFGAIKSISHTGMNQVDWFVGCGNFLNIRPPIHIIRVENFLEDFESLKNKIGLEIDLKVNSDQVSSNMTDYSHIPRFSDKAISNLERWYAQDFELYRQCEKWILKSGGDLTNEVDDI